MAEIPMNLLLADSVQLRPDRFEREAPVRSNAHREDVFWVVTQTADEIHSLIIEVYRSREMVSEYERLASLAAPHTRRVFLSRREKKSS